MCWDSYGREISSWRAVGCCSQTGVREHHQWECVIGIQFGFYRTTGHRTGILEQGVQALPEAACTPHKTVSVHCSIISFDLFDLSDSEKVEPTLKFWKTQTTSFSFRKKPQTSPTRKSSRAQEQFPGSLAAHTTTHERQRLLCAKERAELANCCKKSA